MRIGVDIGGHKIAAIALGEDGNERAREKIDVPHDYRATIEAVSDIVASLEKAGSGPAEAVGLGMPGIISAQGTPVFCGNVPWLQDRPFRRDLAAALDRRVRIANDANCFALSEAKDGAAAGAEVVFGVILGTGVGGGIVVRGRPLTGANANAGEWGHAPLPWREEADGPLARCGCGRMGCLETDLNGAGLARDYARATGGEAEAPEIAERAEAGESEALAAIARYENRLARALASVINFLDPDVIVLGGGLSEIASLYDSVPKQWSNYTSAAAPVTRLAQAKHGPDSGMRGAAWL